MWIYDDEAASLVFDCPRGKLPPELHPIVMGRFRFPDKSQMVLEVRSVVRAIEAAKFFAPRFGSNVVLSRVRIINRWFEPSEVEVGLERLDKLLDANVTRIDPKERLEALERAVSGARTRQEKRKAAGAYVAELRRKDVPLVEDFPLAPEEQIPDLNDLAFTLQLRYTRAYEHWIGNTSTTPGEVIHKLVGA